MTSIDDFKSGIGTRLKFFIKSKGLTQMEFSDKIGVNSSSLSAVATGRAGISAELAHSIINTYPELNWNWLYMDKGEMIIGSNVIMGESNQVGTMVVQHSDNKEIWEEIIMLRERVKGLEEQLKLKDEIISLLKNK